MALTADQQKLHDEMKKRIEAEHQGAAQAGELKNALEDLEVEFAALGKEVREQRRKAFRNEIRPKEEEKPQDPSDKDNRAAYDALKKQGKVDHDYDKDVDFTRTEGTGYDKPAAGAGGGGLGDTLGGLKGAFGDLQAGIGMVKGSFDQVVSSVRPFVEAFAPSAVQAFGQAMRDTQAVVGKALLPVMQALTGVVRGVGDALVPVMAQLEPVINQVVAAFQQLFVTNLSQVLGAFMNVLGPVVDLVMALVEALQPMMTTLQAFQGVILALAGVWLKLLATYLASLVQAITPLLQLFESVTPLLRAFAVIVSGAGEVLASVLKAVLGGGKTGVEGLKDAFQVLARAAIVAAAAVMKMLPGGGFDAFIKGARSSLGGDMSKGGSAGMAAAQNAQITGVPDWARSLAQQAAQAAGGAGTSAEDKFRDEVLGDLEKLATGPSLLAELKRFVENELAPAIAKAIKEGGSSTGKSLLKYTSPISYLISRLGPKKEDG